MAEQEHKKNSSNNGNNHNTKLIKCVYILQVYIPTEPLKPTPADTNPSSLNLTKHTQKKPAISIPELQYPLP